MSIFIPKQVINLAAVIVTAVLLLWAIFYGISVGKLQAQSAAVLNNAGSLSKGLEYFFSDQERFPSASEFQTDANLMLNYFNQFPPYNLVSTKCPSSFSYQRPGVNSFKLNFCLPVASNNNAAGWNQITESK